MTAFIGGLLATVVLWILPESAWAWGPISHLDYAQYALQHLPLYPEAIRTLLTQFPKDFLYGTLAADITVGKSYVDYIYNCHNWRVGFLLLNEAKDERQQASAYGYLVHLAADIIAHNFFVPATSIRSYTRRTLGHVYWEMRFDSRQPQERWEQAKEICSEDFSHNDELFQRMLKRTLFSFKTNKRIFNSILNLHKLDKWRSGMQRLDRKSKLNLSEDDIERFRYLACESVVKFLQDPETAPCTRVDPTGADKLLYAKEARRSLNRAFKKRKISEVQATSFIKEAETALQHAIYEDVPLPDVSELFV